MARMPRNTNRDLPKSADLLAAKEELVAGRRIVVNASAGHRLRGKKGLIPGPGATATQVRVLFDRAKGYVTLHVRYVDLIKSE